MTPRRGRALRAPRHVHQQRLWLMVSKRQDMDLARPVDSHFEMPYTPGRRHWSVREFETCE